MKRFISLSLAIVISLSMLSSCSGNKKGNDKNSGKDAKESYTEDKSDMSEDEAENDETYDVEENENFDEYSDPEDGNSEEGDSDDESEEPAEIDYSILDAGVKGTGFYYKSKDSELLYRTEAGFQVVDKNIDLLAEVVSQLPLTIYTKEGKLLICFEAKPIEFELSGLEDFTDAKAIYFYSDYIIVLDSENNM